MAGKRLQQMLDGEEHKMIKTSRENAGRASWLICILCPRHVAKMFTRCANSDNDIFLVLSPR
jgi:hypothetical protein